MGIQEFRAPTSGSQGPHHPHPNQHQLAAPLPHAVPLPGAPMKQTGDSCPGRAALRLDSHPSGPRSTGRWGWGTVEARVSEDTQVRPLQIYLFCLLLEMTTNLGPGTLGPVLPTMGTGPGSVGPVPSWRPAPAHMPSRLAGWRTAPKETAQGCSSDPPSRPSRELVDQSRGGVGASRVKGQDLWAVQGPVG